MRCNIVSNIGKGDNMEQTKAWEFSIVIYEDTLTEAKEALMDHLQGVVKEYNRTGRLTCIHWEEVAE